MKFKFLFIFSILALIQCGTMIQSNAPMAGIHGTDLDARIFMKVTRSENYSSTIGSRKGETCQKQILGIAAWGDASLPTAKLAGGLSTIDHVSFERMVILNFLPWPTPLFTMICVIAHGN